MLPWGILACLQSWCQVGVHPHRSALTRSGCCACCSSQGLQGGPHNHTISALAVALKMANTQEFKSYQAQVVANCAALSKRMQELGYHVVSGGTDNHLILVDLKPSGIDGARVQTVLDEVSITLNKNSVPGDKSAIIPGGIRIGTPALTTRGFREADFVKVAEFIHRAVQVRGAGVLGSVV